MAMRGRFLLPAAAVLVAAACGGGMRSDQRAGSVRQPDPRGHLLPASSSDESCAVVDLNGLARAVNDAHLIGCEVAVDDLTVERMAVGGFWVRAAGRLVLVVPAEGTLIRVEPGERIDVHGELRGTPAGHVTSDRSWVYAYTVRPAWLHN